MAVVYCTLHPTVIHDLSNKPDHRELEPYEEPQRPMFKWGNFLNASRPNYRQPRHFLPPTLAPLFFRPGSTL